MTPAQLLRSVTFIGNTDDLPTNKRVTAEKLCVSVRLVEAMLAGTRPITFRTENQIKLLERQRLAGDKP